jgi:16S rRNA (uracil1498-N3)-methyltransferase
MSSLYFNSELTPELEVGASASITGAEAHHAVTVGRARVGDRVSIGDGVGLIASGSVTTADRSELTITVESLRFEGRSTPSVWLAQALAKGDRDELAVQAATELGIDGVVPWAASRSISRWEGSKIGKGEERWRAIVREAAKQSIRAWVPEVGPMATTKQLSQLAASSRLVVLDPLAADPLSALEPDGRDIVLIVGPEGGIAEPERTMLYAAGAEGASLGTTILRTSTAGPAAIAVLNAKLGRW